LPGPEARLLESRGYTVLQGQEHGSARTVLIYPPGVAPDYGRSLVGYGEDWTAADAFRQAYARAQAWSVEAAAAGTLSEPLPPLPPS